MLGVIGATVAMDKYPRALSRVSRRLASLCPEEENGKAEYRPGLFLRPNRLCFPTGQFTGISPAGFIALAVPQFPLPDHKGLQVRSQRFSNQRGAIHLRPPRCNFRGAQ